MESWRSALARYAGKRAVIYAFILCALPLGVVSAVLTPLGQSPDEPAHVARAAGLLHGAILGVRKHEYDGVTGKSLEVTGVKVDRGLFAASLAPTTMIGNHPIVTIGDLSAAWSMPADHSKIFPDLPNTATYFPVPYLPATLGLAAGLAVRAPPFDCVTLARLCMLAAFIALGAAALALTRFGEAALLATLLLPMTVFLAGSVNEDGVLIGMACLSAALLTQGSTGARRLGLLVLAVFLGSKPPYIGLFAVFLLPLASAGLWIRLRDIAIACVPVMIWVGLIVAFVIIPYGQTPYHPGPLYAGDHSIVMDHADARANLAVLLAKPIRLITLPWNTVVVWGRNTICGMIGILGPLLIGLPMPLYVAWGISLGIAYAGAFLQRRPVPQSAGEASANFVVTAAAAFGTFWLINIVFYLDWTDVGDTVISGVQGRYLIPILPFLLFGIPGRQWRFTLPPLLPALPAVLMGIFDIAYVPAKLVWTYYVH